MKYYGKIISLICLASVLILILLTNLTYPVYEFYIDDFEKSPEDYSFNLVLDGDAPEEFTLDFYVNEEIIRTTKINFSQKKLFPIVVSKAILQEGINKIQFKIYSQNVNEKFFGSEEKPYTIYKQVNYEKD
jgi:outer membrane usher protein FimD/PapC